MFVLQRNWDHDKDDGPKKNNILKTEESPP